ncbi:MAG: DNA mismatch repair protein MutS [Kiritimatiellae bacterium]|nr:DNA mismatch repair protein MutS [Kiritimatiellia bacterium]
MKNKAQLSTMTPMMQQYRRIKAQLPPNTILFFRLGDFYEMFFEDAVEASAILDIALTKRQKAPMCGVPYHAYENYLSKLIRAGKKVAVCDQVEDPAVARGIVRREVTGIVSPGAVLNEQLLDSSKNNFLAGLYQTGASYGLALLDLSTGEFLMEETESADTLRDNLLRWAPAECVMPASLLEGAGSPLKQMVGDELRLPATPYEDWMFEYASAYETLTNHFEAQSLDGFGCEGCLAGVGAAGGVLHYVKNVLHRSARNVRSLRRKNPDDFLFMDEATRGNLDLVGARVSARGGLAGGAFCGGETAATLLGVLDATRTAMGGRRMREWLLRPLAEKNAVLRRHDAVAAFCEERTLLRDMRAELGRVRDLERLVARLASGAGGARDLRALAQSLGALAKVRGLLNGVQTRLLADLAGQITPLPELADLIERAIVDEPPAMLKDGGAVRSGYNAALDELRAAATQGRAWLAEYQTKEQQRTGIKTLKVRYNQIFGYYLEVSKGQAANVPPDYARKQTLVNAERFITPELKEFENKIIGAQERALALEAELLADLKDKVLPESGRILQSAYAIAALDVLASLADRALALRYARPVMTDGRTIRIKDGRHPVIEQMPSGDRFVPNDTLLDCEANRLIIITGPNMAGKSTYIRQVALIVIMAQMGSFVPASAAEIGVVDRIFTRVGASDDLARGRSTFMVEMQETANILNNATERSLIVLDEIGRGTSTFDGISIAWAVAEYLHDAIKAKALFATHYHELTDIAVTLKGVRNYNVLVREENDRVVFLRKIVAGAADKSYGIQVARLAGLPADVVARAREILLNLEEGEFEEAGQPKIAVHRQRRARDNSLQMDLFGARL